MSNWRMLVFNQSTIWKSARTEKWIVLSPCAHLSYKLQSYSSCYHTSSMKWRRYNMERASYLNLWWGIVGLFLIPETTADKGMSAVNLPHRTEYKIFISLTSCNNFHQLLSDCFMVCKLHDVQWDAGWTDHSHTLMLKYEWIIWWQVIVISFLCLHEWNGVLLWHTVVLIVVSVSVCWEVGGEPWEVCVFTDHTVQVNFSLKDYGDLNRSLTTAYKLFVDDVLPSLILSQINPSKRGKERNWSICGLMFIIHM